MKRVITGLFCAAALTVLAGCVGSGSCCGTCGGDAAACCGSDPAACCGSVSGEQVCAACEAGTCDGSCKEHSH
jgi:hypothetical protein